MISVAIMINANPIMARSACNTGKIDLGTGKVIYRVDDGSTIIHDPEDGATQLAIKLLGTIKEKE